MKRIRVTPILITLWLSTCLFNDSLAQEPIDLFSDEPALADGFIRIAAWNLEHIDVDGDADDFLPGDTEAADFDILIASFAKAVKDLGLDLLAVVELQPRTGEPDRLHEMRDWLNTEASGTWRAVETQIEYDDPSSPFGNLQFGLLWNEDRLSVDENNLTLLEQLRQPRDDDGNLENKRLRAPWLVPVTAGTLSFDLMVLHLKSGGSFPQAQEVQALSDFIEARQSALSPRHLIVCGDWNIRPDKSGGRARLRKLGIPNPDGDLMRVLTVEEIAPTLDGWETLGVVDLDSPLASVLPFTHYNANSIDTFLDHIAISRTMAEIFDHPIRVTLANGETDLRPGIRIAHPRIPEESYDKLTDHLPLILTLRTTGEEGGGDVNPGVLRIVGAEPNPSGSDTQFETVILKNDTASSISLDGWKIGDANGTTFWVLTTTDGVVPPGQEVTVVRGGRPMALNNTGDTIVLINPQAVTVDSKTYGWASSGRIFRFD